MKKTQSYGNTVETDTHEDSIEVKMTYEVLENITAYEKITD